ncbi:LptE family protein [Fulvivirgaceae bacterium BMA12]|uniref:LptE family protein n=1 Tax=Agaribacillus aureus TaxID=3051825 RepID=A0ABT8L7V9_9BACT|nr:LptE family protein [Fulvivirgaceae bacterium BMA12]
MRLKSSYIFMILSLCLLTAIPFLQGCGVYSFTGTNIDYDKVSTISVKRFENLSPGGPPTISQTLTEGIRDIYQQNTRLTVLSGNEEGDLQLEGEIVGYRTAPSTPQASDNTDGVDIASQTRLTITVKVSFINTTNEEEDFDRSFSFFADFDNTQTLNAVEDALIDEIFEQIILDIFNATVANW